MFESENTQGKLRYITERYFGALLQFKARTGYKTGEKDLFFPTDI